MINTNFDAKIHIIFIPAIAKIIPKIYVFIDKFYSGSNYTEHLPFIKNLLPTKTLLNPVLDKKHYRHNDQS